MPVDLDPDTATRLIWLMAAASFLLAIVAAIGEVLGWWNLVGELGIGIGTTAGLLLTAIGILSNASTRQVTSVHQAVLDNGTTLGSMDGKLDSMDTQLTKLDKLDELDVIQAELDQQTGALGEQIAILGEIRDRL